MGTSGSSRHRADPEVKDRNVVDDRREHEHLQLALEAAQLGTWYWDEQTGLTVWDARLEAMHGMAPCTFGGTYGDWEASLYPAVGAS
jgi:PAS domain-containing protein